LRSILPKSILLLCVFCGQKELNAQDIHKEMFSVYGGKGLSRKVVHNWVKKFSRGRSKVADDETEVWKWLRQVYQCWWRIYREINVFFQV
jgi:hypothetical protein